MEGLIDRWAKTMACSINDSMKMDLTDQWMKSVRGVRIDQLCVWSQ